MSEPTYTDFSEITKFRRYGKRPEDWKPQPDERPCSMPFADHTLQYKRCNGEASRRVFVDDNPVEDLDGIAIFEPQITSITQLCYLLDLGDQALDEEFKQGMGW